MRYARVAGAIVGGVGAVFLLAAGVLLVDALSALTGGEGEHMQGDATLWLVLVILPVAIAGLLSLVIARQAWLARPAARLELGIWIMVALVVCIGFWSAEGNALSSLRRLIAEGGETSLVGARLGVTGADGVAYYGYLDDPTFWLPAILGLASVALGLLLVAWLFSSRRDALPAA